MPRESASHHCLVRVHSCITIVHSSLPHLYARPGRGGLSTMSSAESKLSITESGLSTTSLTGSSLGLMGGNKAYGNADRLWDQVCRVSNMLGAGMRLTRALRKLKQCYRTSMSVPLKVSSASRQGFLLLRWLFFTTDLKPDGLDVGRR